ncbi:type II secretion system protein [Candidatus Dojkabacteria bacterium]|nr:type II secretion system protein [Candidatus Dojkabacteria bacterium]
MSKKNSAYTLLELLIVMAIFASMMAIGVVALNNFSNRSNVNTATQDFYTSSKTLIQKARNSVYTQAELVELKNGWTSTCSFTSNSFPPDAIGYRFSDGAAEYIKCSKNSSLSYDFCCVTAQADDVTMRYNEKTNIQAQGDCKGVLFEYATGEVYSFASENLLSINTVKTSCDVQVRHNDISYYKTVVFNGEKNEVYISN